MTNEARYARSIRRLSHLGYATAVLGIGTFVGWTMTAQVASAVIAKGTVSVASSRKSIEHASGGTVSTVDVREGEMVKAGQRLLTLDATETLAQIDILRTRLVAAMAKERRFGAEAGGSSDMDISGALVLSRVGDADPSAVERALAAEHAIFLARKATNDRQIEIFRNQRSQYLSQAESHEARLGKLDAQIRDTGERLEQLRKLTDGGFVAKGNLVEKQNDLGELEDSRASIALQRDTALSAADAVELERLKADQARQEEIGKELADTRADVVSLAVQLETQRQLLSRNEIRAPQAGVVQNLRVRSAGAVVVPGNPIMELVPVADDLVINMQLPVNFADQVSPGMAANLRFSSLQSFHTMQMDGTVERISPDAVPDEQGRRTIVNGEIRLDLGSAPIELASRIRPGIEAEIVIPTAERTVASFLTKPLTDAFAHSMRER